MEDIYVGFSTLDYERSCKKKIPVNEEELLAELGVKSEKDIQVVISWFPANINVEGLSLNKMNAYYYILEELYGTPMYDNLEELLKAGKIMGLFHNIEEMFLMRKKMTFHEGVTNTESLMEKRLYTEYPQLKELPDRIMKYFDFCRMSNDMRKGYYYLYTSKGIFEVKK